MHKFNFSARKLFLILIVLTICTTLGCGGGGGGGSNPVGPGTDVAPDSVVAPGTASLAVPSAMYNYASIAKNTSFVVPVNDSAAKFALIVANVSGSSQNIQLKPESYVLGSVKTPTVMASVELTNGIKSRVANQAHAERNFRAKFLASRAQNSRLMRSIRASDHSGEVLGDIVSLKIVSNTFGTAYIARNCKLERVSAHGKFFVDQDPYLGLSAVTGADAVTSSDLDHFVAEFETHIWNLINTGYASPYDIDNDGRVSIVFSPVYSKLGFAGLFNSNNFSTTDGNSNQRDLIAIFSPETSNNWSGDRWREAARETICHEMQHLVNYSANMYANGVGRMEDEWLDEGLSVGSEARYRILRGDSASENRFSLWASSPSSYSMTTFYRALAQYGQVGLFTHYIYEQGGAAAIKNIVNNNVFGTANVDEIFPTRKMRGMFRDWSMANLMEALKSSYNLSGVDNKYKYQANLSMAVTYPTISYGYSSEMMSLPSYTSAYFVISQPANFGSDEYRFRIESEANKDIEVLMVRLP